MFLADLNQPSVALNSQNNRPVRFRQKAIAFVRPLDKADTVLVKVVIDSYVLQFLWVVNPV